MTMNRIVRSIGAAVGLSMLWALVVVWYSLAVIVTGQSVDWGQSIAAWMVFEPISAGLGVSLGGGWVR